MIKFSRYDNKSKKKQRLLCSNSLKVMLWLCKNMLEFCFKFLALIKQGKLEMMLHKNLQSCSLYFETF